MSSRADAGTDDYPPASVCIHDIIVRLLVAGPTRSEFPDLIPHIVGSALTHIECVRLWDSDTRSVDVLIERVLTRTRHPFGPCNRHSVLVVVPFEDMSADTSTVARLLHDLARDLDAHFEQVVLLYQRQLYNFAFRMTGTYQDAEEVTQDAFVRAYRALQGYDSQRIRDLALQAWLYRITHNLVRNKRRRTAPWISSIDQDGAAPIQDSGRSVVETYETIETSHELAGHLSKLPEKYRTPIVLRFVNDLSYAEIAETLEQPVGTVKSNVHRGIARLREVVESEPAGVR